MTIQTDALNIWRAGVQAADARELVRQSVAVDARVLRIGDLRFPISGLERLVVVGFGKASGAMAVGLEDALGNLSNHPFAITGWVNVPIDQVVPTQAIHVFGCRPGGVNLPTELVVTGTHQILALLKSLTARDICLCLISGGGSALLESPVDSISLHDLRVTSSYLSSVGVSIDELNAVRRSLSTVKAGGLVAAAGPAPIVSLILSDVVGDSIEVIASGPTYVGNSKNALDPLAVIRAHDPVGKSIPRSVWDTIERNSSNPGPAETDETDELRNDRTTQRQPLVHNVVIGNLETGMRAAEKYARQIGYDVQLHPPTANEGDAREVGCRVADQILAAQATGVCEITSGETTVHLPRDPGRGGRNQHLVLAALERMIAGVVAGATVDRDFCLLSGGTDGEDGNVSVAGAWFDATVLRRLTTLPPAELEELRRSIRQALDRCDSFSFFSKHDLLLQTGPTGTNICDLRILINGCEPPAIPIRRL